MKETKIKLKKQHKAFLAWLRETFGTTVNRVSLSDIGLMSGESPQNVRNYMYRLEACGCITINKMSPYKWVININSEESKEETMNEK